MNDTIKLTSDERSNVSRLPIVSAGMPSPEEIDAAHYPALYVAAVHALEMCVKIDEVKALHNKWDAICCYAKMQKSEELERLAKQIRLRAERQLGLLLRQLARSPTHTQSQQDSQEPAAVPSVTREGARARMPDRAKGQGLWAQAQKQGLAKETVSRALTFAAVPEKDFDEIVEQPEVPGRQALADQLRQRTPRNPREGLTTRRIALKALRDFDQFWSAHTAEDLARSFCNPAARTVAITLVQRIQKALGAFSEALDTPPELPLPPPAPPPEPAPAPAPVVASPTPPEPANPTPPEPVRPARKKKMTANRTIRDYTRQTVRGESNSLAFFCSKYGKDYATTFRLLREGATIEQALGLKAGPKSPLGPAPPGSL